VNGNVVNVRVGTQLLLDGDLVQVVELDGGGVTVRNERTGQFGRSRSGGWWPAARRSSGAPRPDSRHAWSPRAPSPRRRSPSSP
jgi:hypothetical protein